MPVTVHDSPARLVLSLFVGLFFVDLSALRPRLDAGVQNSSARDRLRLMDALRFLFHGVDLVGVPGDIGWVLMWLLGGIEVARKFGTGRCFRNGSSRTKFTQSNSLFAI